MRLSNRHPTNAWDEGGLGAPLWRVTMAPKPSTIHNSLHCKNKNKLYEASSSSFFPAVYSFNFVVLQREVGEKKIRGKVGR